MPSVALSVFAHTPSKTSGCLHFKAFVTARTKASQEFPAVDEHLRLQQEFVGCQQWVSRLEGVTPGAHCLVPYERLEMQEAEMTFNKPPRYGAVTLTGSIYLERSVFITVRMKMFTFCCFLSFLACLSFLPISIVIQVSFWKTRPP